MNTGCLDNSGPSQNPLIINKTSEGDILLSFSEQWLDFITKKIIIYATYLSLNSQPSALCQVETYIPIYKMSFIDFLGKFAPSPPLGLPDF